MKFRLAGLASLIRRSPTDSEFLIPFFSHERSNKLYAQELDELRIVKAFGEFDPFKYHVVDRPFEAVEICVGEIGISAYYRVREGFVVGRIDEIISRLASRKLEFDDAPFFELDAYWLTGQQAKLAGAVLRAKALLGRGAVADDWEGTERAAELARRFPAADETIRKRRIPLSEGSRLEYVRGELRKAKKQEERLSIVLDVLLGEGEFGFEFFRRYKGSANFENRCVHELRVEIELNKLDAWDGFDEVVASRIRRFVSYSYPFSRGILLYYLAKRLGDYPTVGRAIGRIAFSSNDRTVAPYLDDIQEFLAPEAWPSAPNE